MTLQPFNTDLSDTEWQILGPLLAPSRAAAVRVSIPDPATFFRASTTEMACLIS
jgi:hypothetical protein